MQIKDINFEVWLPNSFTPNGDGVNDLFSVNGIGLSEFKMIIVNRWNKTVFESNDPGTGWNGKENGTGADCKEDVYCYKIVIKDPYSFKHIYENKIKLIR